MWMGILGRTVLKEVAVSSVLGTLLFTVVLFLQKVGSARFFEVLVRSNAPPEAAARILLLVFPSVLTFTIPIGVLIGTLIALSRMSADGEITAMRAGGVPSRRVVAPVLVLASVGTLLAGAASLWLTPYSIRETYRVLNRLLAAEITAEIQPRVFEEQFPRTILYVGDVIPGPVFRWKGVFMADLTPAEQRAKGGAELSDAPRITVAAEALALPDLRRNSIQLSLLDGRSYEAGKDPAVYYTTGFPRGEQVLEAERPGQVRTARPYVEMDTAPLMREARASRDAAIELHQRLALPPACLLLALVGIPLGVSQRKGGKSTAVVVTVFLAFLYYLGLISLIGLARQGTLPVAAAVWAPNAVFTVSGVILLARLEKPGDNDRIGQIRAFCAERWARLRRRFRAAEEARPSAGMRRLPLLPQIIDGYILSSFLFYFGVLLASFVLLIHVFQFFELLSDMVKNRIPMSRMFTFLFFLTPKLIYDSTPVSVLVAVLVTFGVLSKNNEITAMKACGVSLYRLSTPVLLASLALTAGLFVFDHYVVPDANVKQDAVRNEIKGRPVQTYLRPDRKWIRGEGSGFRVYYYRYFDASENVMLGVQVYELDPATFRMKRHISAERARWEPALKTWIFQNGWSRTFGPRNRDVFQDFTGQTATFQELTEAPGYFLKEVKQDKQMNFRQLDAYIRELKQSGFETVKLQVQYYKKFSVPVFALIMALMSTPFAFLTGNRGAMTGVGLSLGIAAAYWSVNLAFEQLGNLNQLPPAVAAWAPNVIFSVAGLYLMTRLRT